MGKQKKKNKNKVDVADKDVSIDVADKDVSIFTRSELIERYTKNIAMWIDMRSRYGIELINKGKDFLAIENDPTMKLMSEKIESVINDTRMKISDDTIYQEILARAYDVFDI